MKTLKNNEEYDVLIVGGGATGAGCALDACTRGNLLTCFSFFLTQYLSINYTLLLNSRLENSVDRRR